MSIKLATTVQARVAKTVASRTISAAGKAMRSLASRAKSLFFSKSALAVGVVAASGAAYATGGVGMLDAGLAAYNTYFPLIGILNKVFGDTLPAFFGSNYVSAIATSATGNLAVSGAAGLGVLGLVYRGIKAYNRTELYQKERSDVVRDAAHKKKVDAKLKELTDEPNKKGDEEFMKEAIYLDLCFMDHLAPALLQNTQFFTTLLEDSKRRFSPRQKQNLVNLVLEKQQIIATKADGEIKEFLEMVATFRPASIPEILTKYGQRFEKDPEALKAFLRLTLPEPKAKKAQVAESNPIQVATVQAILKIAHKDIATREFLLDLGEISQEGMRKVLFAHMQGEPVASDHLNYMIAKAEKDPKKAVEEAQYLQNNPAFMAAACAQAPLLLADCSTYLLETPAFLAALFDRNPQAAKEVLKTAHFKELLAKNKQKLPRSLFKEILRFSHDARWVDCVTASLPDLSASSLLDRYRLAKLTAQTPSLFKTKFLQSKGLTTNADFIKRVLRNDPWALHDLPKAAKTKKLLGEMLVEWFPLANRGRNYFKKQMWLHEELIAAIARDPECKGFVEAGGLLTKKSDLRVAYRAKREMISHEGSWESRVKPYLEILTACPEMIEEIPHPGDNAEWEKFVVQACRKNPDVIEYLSDALKQRLQDTSSEFIKALYKARKDSSQDALTRIQGGITQGAVTEGLFEDKHFLAELAKIDRMALHKLSSEDKKDATFARELDHKHRLGKGTYNFFEDIEDKRIFGSQTVRSVASWAKNRVKSRSLRAGNHKDSVLIGPLDWVFGTKGIKDNFRNSVENYNSYLGEKKFEDLRS